MKIKNRKIAAGLIFAVVIIAGVFVFDTRVYAFASFAAAALLCVLFFLSFEQSRTGARMLMMIAVITALSVVGRIAFSAVPFFKPVTALTVFAGIYFGPNAGFMCGALSALISNFYFGQGAWTPFQMLAWGISGFFAGVLSSPLMRSKLLLSVYGLFSGVVFSLIMDVWTVAWYDGGFSLTLYLAALASSLPFTAVYAVSNVIFLLTMKVPVGDTLRRIKCKYLL